MIGEASLASIASHASPNQRNTDKPDAWHQPKQSHGSDLQTMKDALVRKSTEGSGIISGASWQHARNPAAAAYTALSKQPSERNFAIITV